MDSFFKYMPTLILGIIVIIAISFIVKNFLTIIAGGVIILIVYTFLTNNKYRKSIMRFLSNVSKKAHNFYDDNVKDDEK